VLIEWGDAAVRVHSHYEGTRARQARDGVTNGRVLVVAADEIIAFVVEGFVSHATTLDGGVTADNESKVTFYTNVTTISY
jgi:hypothetical protein